MLSQTAEYALRAMTSMAYDPDSLLPTPTLAKRTGVPVNYLAKVLQLLSGADLIVGRRGVGGGYRLARGVSEVRLIDIVNAVSPVPRPRLPEALGQQGRHLEPLVDRLNDAVDRAMGVYESSTLADLIADDVDPATTPNGRNGAASHGGSGASSGGSSGNSSGRGSAEGPAGARVAESAA